MENQFHTIRTFNLSNEIMLPKAFLEAEGIFCFVKDELLIQTQPLYSHAIGGIKLQVRFEDLQKANEILIFHGYPEDKPAQNALIYDLLVNFTSKIPLLSKIRFELRFAVLLTFLVVVLYFIISVFS